jgi:formylglycine-generating enzyme required for sulfatase activity
MGDLTSIGDDNERPVREVSIMQDFALSRYEVTFAEYDLFANATGRPLPNDEGWGRGTRPVINVSWLDAKAYTQWLSKVTGKTYRLPSEAEWEYSARAGSSTDFWWGNQMLPGMSVCDGCGSEWDAQQTAPVGQLQANPWGLYDMNGNVEEWVEDCYSDTYAIAPNDGRPLTQPNCHYRVLRGGSWFDIDRVTRSSSRYRHPADTLDSTRGFRVALELTP